MDALIDASPMVVSSAGSLVVGTIVDSVVVEVSSSTYAASLLSRGHMGCLLGSMIGGSISSSHI